MEFCYKLVIFPTSLGGGRRGEMLKTIFEGPIPVRSRTSVRGRAVPGSLRGLMSLQGITGNTQVRSQSKNGNYKSLGETNLRAKIQRAVHGRYNITTCLIFFASGQKPFKCHLCGRQFSRSDHLSLHMKRH